VHAILVTLALFVCFYRYNAAAVNTLYTAVHPAKMLGGGPAASEADNKTAALQRDRSRVQQVRKM